MLSTFALCVFLVRLGIDFAFLRSPLARLARLPCLFSYVSFSRFVRCQFVSLADSLVIIPRFSISVNTFLKVFLTFCPSFFVLVRKRRNSGKIKRTVLEANRPLSLTIQFPAASDRPPSALHPSVVPVHPAKPEALPASVRPTMQSSLAHIPHFRYRKCRRYTGRAYPRLG